MKQAAIAALFLLAAAAAQATAQTRLGVMTLKDTLTAEKRQFRDVVAELRDTLTRVQASHSLISRAHDSGMSGVVVSESRRLLQRCRAGMAMANITRSRIANLRTNAAQGDQALASYRNALDVLTGDLDSCAVADSVALHQVPLDQAKALDIAAAATLAIDRYDVSRDAMLGLLGIRLPIAGNIYH
ncbi:MAG: hypothetical protein ACREL5_00735 [Gemmatimonadales bacterium]